MLHLSDKMFDIIKISIAIAVFIELPGLIIHRLFLRNKSFIAEDLGFCFTIGAGIFVPFSFACYYFQLTLSIAIAVYAIFLFGLLFSYNNRLHRAVLRQLRRHRPGLCVYPHAR